MKEKRLTYNLTVRLTPQEDAVLQEAADKMSGALGWRVGKGTILRVGGLRHAREILQKPDEEQVAP